MIQNHDHFILDFCFKHIYPIVNVSFLMSPSSLHTAIQLLYSLYLFTRLLHFLHGGQLWPLSIVTKLEKVYEDISEYNITSV